MTWTSVCRVDELRPGEIKQIETSNGLSVLVARSNDGQYFVYPSRCPHEDEPLANGMCDGELITCHKHLWQFQLKTGAPVGMAQRALKLYTVRERDGFIQAEFSAELSYERD